MMVRAPLPSVFFVNAEHNKPQRSRDYRTRSNIYTRPKKSSDNTSMINQGAMKSYPKLSKRTKQSCPQLDRTLHSRLSPDCLIRRGSQEERISILERVLVAKGVVSPSGHHTIRGIETRISSQIQSARATSGQGDGFRTGNHVAEYSDIVEGSDEAGIIL